VSPKLLIPALQDQGGHARRTHCAPRVLAALRAGGGSKARSRKAGGPLTWAGSPPNV